MALINGHLLRKDYSRIGKVVNIPDLIEVQKKSFKEFLQLDAKPEDRKNSGLNAVFKGLFPVKDFGANASLDFVKYLLLASKYTVEECIEKGLTFAAPMKILVPVKRVVDFNVRVRVKPDGSGMATDGLKMSINPFDEIALPELQRRPVDGDVQWQPAAMPQCSLAYRLTQNPVADGDDDPGFLRDGDDLLAQAA